MSADEAFEYEVANVNDFTENQLKEVEIKAHDQSYKVLLAKYENKFYAVGNKCTHFGLPLANGFFFNGRIRCFAHGACFDVKTGDIEDTPGVDCLPSYKIKVNEETNKVYIVATKAELEVKKRAPNSALTESSVLSIQRPVSSLPQSSQSSDAVDGKVRPKSAANTINVKLLIVGSGSAGLQCVETLRQRGYNSEITFLTKEQYVPYDRTKLSKSLDFDIEQLSLRNEEYYKKANITFYKNKTVKSIDLNLKQVECNDNKFFKFSKLVIATGLQPVQHKAANENVNGVVTLRSLDDAKSIFKYFNEAKASNVASAKPLNVVIVGSSFIALESATYFNGKANVTVICHSKPFSKQLGDAISDRLCKLHESKGVKLLIQPNLEVVEFVADENKRLSSAKLSNGEVLSADLCLVAIGSKPQTSFLNGSPIKLTANGYIVVDEYMRTNINDVYAVGDVVHFPRKCLQTPINELDDNVNVGHWHMAGGHGKCAAFTLMEHLKPLKCVPFFWTTQYGKSIRFVGHNDSYDEIVFFDDPEKKNDMKFCAFYIKKENVVAVCTCDFDPICATFAELLYNNIWVKKNDIANEPWGFKKLISK